MGTDRQVPPVPAAEGPALGTSAPDFTLPDTHGTPVRARDLRGQAALLVFFPFAFSRLCHQEIAGLNEHLDTFAAAGVQVLGISCDSVHTLRTWGDQEGFTMPLLSDFWPHGRAAAAYGVFDDDAGHPVRGSVLIDAAGQVVWTTISPAGRPRSLTAHIEAVRALPGTGAPAGPTGPVTPRVTM